MLNKALPNYPPISIANHSGHIHRSASEPVAYFPPRKPSGFSFFSRRKRSSTEKEAPPPTPPKDVVPYTQQWPSRARPRNDSAEQVYPAYVGYHYNSDDYPREHDYDYVPSQHYGESTPDVAHLTHDESDMVVIEPYRSHTLEARWAAEPFAISDPAERARRRMEARRRKEKEERRAAEEEEERQRLLKLRKQAIMDQEKKEMLMRQTQLEHEMREATAERTRRAQAEREEDVLKVWEAAERKRISKERRADVTRRLEQWRAEDRRRNELIKRTKEDEISRKEGERKAQIRAMEIKIRKDSTSEMTTGWVSVQVSDAFVLQWRRRFFKFSESNLAFFRGPQVGAPVSHV